jgi:xylulokinase
MADAAGGVPGGDCCSLRLPDDALFLGLDCSTQ